MGRRSFQELPKIWQNFDFFVSIALMTFQKLFSGIFFCQIFKNFWTAYAENPVILTVLMVVFILYVVFLIWAIIRDKAAREGVSIQ